MLQYFDFWRLLALLFKSHLLIERLILIVEFAFMIKAPAFFVSTTIIIHLSLITFMQTRAIWSHSCWLLLKTCVASIKAVLRGQASLALAFQKWLISLSLVTNFVNGWVILISICETATEIRFVCCLLSCALPCRHRNSSLQLPSLQAAIYALNSWGWVLRGTIRSTACRICTRCLLNAWLLLTSLLRAWYSLTIFFIVICCLFILAGSKRWCCSFSCRHVWNLLLLQF